MNLEKLNHLMNGVKTGDDAISLLKEIHSIVYGDAGWNSEYRIDDFECTKWSVRLSIGNRALGTVYRKCTTIMQKQTLRRVA